MNREKYEPSDGDLGCQDESTYHGGFRNGWKQFERKIEFFRN